jgi:membrane-bound metal-dependent hydrolase YbcI (DUF457 family)
MLVGAAAAEGVSAFNDVPRYRAWAVGAAFALLPDLDYAIRILTGEFAPLERSVLHSLTATAAAVAAVLLVAGWRWAAVAGSGYASHLLADMLQHQSGTSVALFWPLQEHAMEPLLPLFPFVPVERGGGVLGAAISLFGPDSFPPLLQSTVIAAAFLLAAMLLSRRIRARRRAEAAAS